MTRIAVLMTCHNRRQITLACLEALHRQKTNLQLDVYLLDDGSSDGTAEAVAAAYPRVRLRKGDGSFFWCGGMRRLWTEAVKDDYDYYLWLNDDTILDPYACETLLKTAENEAVGGIVVGTVRDPETGKPSFGGVIRSSWWHPFRYRLVFPNGGSRRCDTMNGNCVLVSRGAAQRLGNLDGAFQHSLGDFDYGLRATANHLPVVAAPGTVGTCPRGETRQAWRDAALPWRQRWAAVTGPKGLPPGQMLIYARRHGGLLWPVFWIMPYLRAMLMPTRGLKVRWQFLEPSQGA
jgi:GT2 family glycosyltransferase